MNAIVVILAALLVVASAQIPICYKDRCQGLNQDCNFVDTVNFVVYGCKGGLTCAIGSGTNGTCLKEHKLQESCTDGAACVDSKYSISCFSGTCLYPGGLGPSEDCSGATAANYINSNPCAGGSTCSGTCSGSNGAVDTTCDDTLGKTQTCAPGLYCAFGKGTNGTSVCKARLGAGVQCTGTQDCQWSLICTSRGATNFTCEAPFAQGVGSGCTSQLDCNANLWCDSGKCANDDQNGVACTVADANNFGGTCPSGYACVCTSGKAGSVDGKCEVSTVPQSTINEVLAYFTCMNSNCKFDAVTAGLAHTNFLVSFTPDSCVAKKCSGQFSNLRDYATGLTGGCGGGSPASVVSVFAFLVATMAAIALMF